MKQHTACRRHIRPTEGACPFCKELLRTTLRAGAVILLGVLAASCVLRPYTDSASEGTTFSTTTGTSASITSAATDSASTTTASTPTTTAVNPTTGEQTTTHDPDTTLPGCPSFICPNPDLGPPKECDPWTQDCPPGEKCMPYSGDGDSSWESLGCFPVMENPGQAGEPCTVEGSGVSGIDSCDIGHMCWNLDPDTGEGTCVKFCIGSEAMPMCEVPTTACTISGPLILCLPNCDPLIQNCPGGDLCIPNPMNLDSFICVLDASFEEGQEFDPCEYANACDPGLMCNDPVLATECDQQALGCCLAFCDTSAPACTGQNAECIPWYAMGMAPPGLENVGICGIPQ